MGQTIAKQVNEMANAIANWLYDKNGGNKYRRALMPDNATHAPMPSHYGALADTIEKD